MIPVIFKLDMSRETTVVFVDSSQRTPVQEHRDGAFAMFQVLRIEFGVWRYCLNETRMDACFVRDECSAVVGQVLRNRMKMIGKKMVLLEKAIDEIEEWKRMLR